MSVIHPQSLAAQLSGSQMSRVKTVVEKEEEVKVAEWCETFLFPFFAEIAAKTSPLPIVTFIQLFLTFLQNMSSFFYFSSDYVWKSGLPEWFVYISYSTNLGVIKDPIFTQAYPQYIVHFTYFVLELILFLTIFLWYQSNRSFLMWQLRLCRFFLSTNLFFVVIGANLTGYAFVEATNKQTIDTIAILVVSLVITVAECIIVYYSNWLLSYSPYLSRSITATWMSASQNVHYLFLTINTFFGAALNVFPHWLFLFEQVASILICVYQMYFCSFLPYVGRSMNVIVFGFISEQLIAAILSFIKNFFEASEGMLVLDFIVVIILSMIFFYYGYFKPQEKKIIKILASDQERMTPEQINQFFDNISFSSHRSAQLFLHVGITNLCRSITDFSFMRYMVDNYMQTPILFSILQITSFFPCEQQFLSYLLTIVKQIPNIHFGENFMIYQIQKIRIIRQSSVSLEASSALELLKKMSLDTISQVRGFWSEILHSKSDISISSLYFLRKITAKTNTAFMDAIDKYPNSQGLNDAYCTFLIEAKGDFSKAVQISHRLSLIEQGKQFVTDLAFLNFVNVFPDYLRLRVLTIHGNRALNDMSSIESSADRSLEWSTENFDMDLLNKKCEDIIVGMIDHGKLRLAFQHAMKFFTPLPLRFMLFLIIFQFIAYFAISIVMLSIVPNISKKPLVMMKSFTHTNNYITSYLYMADICCGFQVQEVSDMFLRGDCLDHISKTLNISIKKLKGKPSIFNEPAISLHQSIIDFQDEFMKESRLAVENIGLHKDMMKFLTEDSMAEMIQYNPLSFTETSKFNISLKSRLASQASILDYISSYLEKNNYDSQIILSMGSIMRDIFASGPLINQLFDYLSPPSLEVCDENEQQLREISTIIVSTFAAFFTITELLTYFFIHRSNKRISNLLRMVKPEVINSSNKPISKKGNKRDLSTGSRHSPHDFSFTMATMPLVLVASILVATLLLILACINYADSISFIKQLFVISYHASLRAANIQSIFLNIALNKTGMTGDYFSVDELTIDNYLVQILDTTSKLNLGLIGRSDFFDSYYFSDTSVNKLTDETDFADFIDSISISNRLNLAYMYLQIVFILHKVRTEAMIQSDFDFLFGNEFTNFLFLLDMYVADLLKDLQLKLYDFTENKFETMLDFVLILSVLTLVASSIIFVIDFFMIKSLLMSYDFFKQLILLINPVEIMKNKAMLELITGYNSDDTLVTLKPSELILTSMESGIITIDKDLIIQNVNESVQELTGFTPDQILGQGITFLVPVPLDENHKIDISLVDSFYPVVHDIIDGIGDPSTTVDIEIMTESSALMKTQMTIIPFYAKEEIESITLIFQGVQEKLVQTQKLKFLQQRIDILLQSSIPKCLLNDPNFGERATLFRVKEAVFIYFEICGLGDFVFTMSPKQLINAMSMVYKSIESVSKKYESICPVKENDDCYIVVMGLFNEIGCFDKHVNDAVCFAEEVMDQIEEVNEQLGVDINLGIGIHKGGPVVGYIEDPSSLKIDILSEALRAAIKIQELGERNIIQITQSAVDYILNPKYEKFAVHSVKAGDFEEKVYYLREIEFINNQTKPAE